MAKKAYIGVEKLTTTAVDLADVDSLQEFWVGRYDPYGNAPEWNSQSGGYEFSGNSVYAQDFYREINDGRIQVESNTIYFIPDSYPQYFVKVIYINYQQSLQPDEFITYKTENKGVARKIKKGYVGVGGAACKIKKAYIGIGGVARPCWAGGELGYYGTVTALSSVKCRLAATSNQNYALFGGGFNTDSDGYNYLTSVNAYNKQLMQTTATKLPYGTCDLAATSIGDYALFGGGYGYTTYVTAYNASLVQSLPDALSERMQYCAAASIGNYALFGGGATNPSLVEAYNSSLVKCTVDQLSRARYKMAATSIGDYALFGGGFDITYSTGSNIVDAYNTALVRSTPTTFSVNNPGTGAAVGSYLSATNNHNYALFGGIEDGNGTYNVVNAYNTSLVRSVPDVLSNDRTGAAAASIGDFALFAGGYSVGNSVYTANNGVDAYNNNLVKSSPGGLSVARYMSAATSIGEYVLFGGGTARTGNTFYNTVDAYTLV